MIEMKFKQTEIGLIPDDWEVRSIGSLCKVHGRIGFRGYTTNDLVSVARVLLPLQVKTLPIIIWICLRPIIYLGINIMNRQK